MDEDEIVSQYQMGDACPHCGANMEDDDEDYIKETGICPHCYKQLIYDGGDIGEISSIEEDHVINGSNKYKNWKKHFYS